MLLLGAIDSVCYCYHAYVAEQRGHHHEDEASHNLQNKGKHSECHGAFHPFSTVGLGLGTDDLESRWRGYVSKRKLRGYLRRMERMC